MFELPRKLMPSKLGMLSKMLFRIIARPASLKFVSSMRKDLNLGMRGMDEAMALILSRERGIRASTNS